jgi:curved DNA-binding protein CbpA
MVCEMDTDTKFNYYEILEISPGVNQSEIFSAYQRLRDTYSGKNMAIFSIFTEQEAKEYLCLVEEAYSVLGNKNLRSLYDQKFFAGEATPESLSFQSLNQESKAVMTQDVKRVASAFRLNYTRNEKFEAEIESNQEWNGEWLKKVREYKQVSLDQLSHLTKINPFYIKAVEEMKPEHLPVEVFVRGYVVQIARTLGLKADQVATSYMKLYKAKLRDTGKTNSVRCSS